MTNTQKLEAGQNAFITAWGRSHMFKIGTIEDFFAKSTVPADVQEQRIAAAHASKEANAAAWAMNTGAAIVNDPSCYERLRAEQEAAIEIDPNAPVSINGRLYSVRVMGKNYSDPIHLKEVEA